MIDFFIYSCDFQHQDYFCTFVLEQKIAKKLIFFLQKTINPLFLSLEAHPKMDHPPVFRYLES